jgi:hypothetical protein
MTIFYPAKKIVVIITLALIMIFPQFLHAQFEEDAALLTVIRNADRKSKVHKPKLFINGKKKCIIPDAGYTTFKISQGEHAVFAAFNTAGKSGENLREASLSINAEPGQHYYILMVIPDVKRKIVSVTPIMETGAARLMKNYRKCDCSKP